MSRIRLMPLAFNSCSSVNRVCNGLPWSQGPQVLPSRVLLGKPGAMLIEFRNGFLRCSLLLSLLLHMRSYITLCPVSQNRYRRTITLMCNVVSCLIRNSVFTRHHSRLSVKNCNCEALEGFRASNFITLPIHGDLYRLNHVTCHPRGCRVR